ncbi:hypothetical protein PRIC2_008533 [Phytophthora ramorum]
MAAGTRDRDSAGRLLRVLQDCELFHMEAAITSLDRVKNGIRSESLLKPSGSDDVDVLERTGEGRVLSLSDHKRIARLQAALSTVADAYEVGNEVGTTAQNRNLVCAVAAAAIMQATRDCTASRTNCCIWGPQAEKLHVLLNWMMNRECAVASLSHDFVRELLLDWIQPIAEKQNQLAACLALFELLQRRRRKMMTVVSGSECPFLLGDRAGAYMDALRGIIERGVRRVADSQRVKLSKLALIALEALALLCGDIAAIYLMSDEATKRSYASKELMHKMVTGVRFFLTVLRQWHLDSTRREFLSYALQHLQWYATACDALLLSKHGEAATGSDLNEVVVLDMMCWHWEATASLLCTRSEASSQIQNNQPSEVLSRALKRWILSVLDIKPNTDRDTTNREVLYAQLRYICILLDSIGGVKGCSQAFKSLSTETKQYFVFIFVRGMATAIKKGDEAAVCFILKVLRSVLLPSDAFGLLATHDDEQELLSQLLRLCDNELAVPVHSGFTANGSQDQTELELFVADFIISRELFITEIVVNLQDFHIRRIRKIISLVRTFIYQLDGADTQVPLYRHWRRQLTPVLLGLIDNENDHVRRLALSCLPSLDPMSCIAGLCAAGVHDTENLIVASSGGLQTSKVSSEAPGSPRYWNEYDLLLKGNTKDNNGLEELQEKLLLLCFGPNGWNKYVQFANARSKVLSVLLRKIFGSPRDTLLFRMLRQFVACGWVDEAVFQTMGKQLTAHMMNLQRLSEDLLDDTSSSAAKATEGLLFSRLAPFLVLRMLPRQIFGYNCATTLACGREDLDHLNEYIDHQRYNDPATAPESDGDVTNERLFHILACSVVDPLEFKEVKMLATEGLAKFPPTLVLPFAFAYLIAFLREATPHHEQNSSLIVSEEIVPDVCGLVTAKLMVYYLNRVFSEDMYNGDITSKALVVLVKILGIPCAPGSSFAMDESLLIDLQRGCIDCIASILTRLTEDECEQDSTKLPTADGSSLLNLLVVWIFGGTKDEPHVTDDDHKTLGSRVQTLFVSVWSEIRHGDLPLQLRVCCCNVLLSAISRSDNNMLASWKAQRLISRVALAIEHCSEDGVVAGGLQVIFAFLYKASELLSMENNADLQLVRICFEIAAARLEVTQSESVGMSGLKVVGALVGKLPAFIGALPPAELQRLIDSCLISLRDRQVSPAVSNLAQSLLQAMTSS